jgi:hypothetical protein
MRFVEIATIYLAVGASVGAASFPRVSARCRSRMQACFAAAMAIIFFPITLALLFVSRPRNLNDRIAQNELLETGDREMRDASLSDAEIEDAKRALVSALRRLEDFTASDAPKDEQLRHAISRACYEIERYAELSRAVREAISDAAPKGREIELCRISGRTGEDLALAARCIQRRIRARLLAHLENSRDEFFDAIAKMNEVLIALFAAADHPQVVRDFTVSILQICDRAIDLAQLFDDAKTAARFTELRQAARAKTDERHAHTHNAFDINSPQLKTSRVSLT